MLHTDLKIAHETVELARQRDMKYKDHELPESMHFKHIESMYEAMKSRTMDEGKRGRFIGWMQAAVCASGCAEMNEFRLMNTRIANEAPKAQHSYARLPPEHVRGASGQAIAERDF